MLKLRVRWTVGLDGGKIDVFQIALESIFMPNRSTSCMKNLRPLESRRFQLRSRILNPGCIHRLRTLTYQKELSFLFTSPKISEISFGVSYTHRNFSSIARVIFFFHQPTFRTALY